MVLCCSFGTKRDATRIDIKSNIQTPEISQINHLVNITLTNSSLDKNETFDIFNNTVQLRDIETDIEVMRKGEPLSDTISYHDIHHYVAIYVLFGIVGLGLVIWAWKRFKRVMMTAGVEPVAPEPVVRATAVARSLPTLPTSTNIQCSDVNEVTSSDYACVLVNKKSNPKEGTSARVLHKNAASSPIVLRSEF
ncbi:hypothetical protein ACJJTC_018524 [Scirpophaga incertulas]